MKRIWQRPLLAAWCLAALPAYAGDDGESIPSVRGELTGYQVTMTWVSGNNRYAAINGGFYAVGDTMPDGTRVLAVESGIVRLQKNGVEDYVRIVDQPPAPRRQSSAAAGPADNVTSYLDHAVAELDQAIDASVRRGAPADEAARLERLRSRLEAARDRLRSPELSDAERREIEARFDRDWLAAQQTLDELRRRLAASGSGQAPGDLIASRRVLEQATMAALRQPLGRLLEQTPGMEAPGPEEEASLMELAMELLSSYPDYQKLAEQLSQFEHGGGQQ